MKNNSSASKLPKKHIVIKKAFSACDVSFKPLKTKSSLKIKRISKVFDQFSPAKSVYQSLQSLDTTRSHHAVAPRADSLGEDHCWLSAVSSPRMVEIKEAKSLTEVLLESSGKEVLSYLHSLEGRFNTDKCLENHKITANLRARMVDWMREVFRILKNDQAAIFLATCTMDRFLSLTSTSIANTDIHLVAIACISLASKLNSSIKAISLQTLFNSVGHKAFSKEDILNKELEVFKTLSFQLEISTCYDFLLFYMSMIEDPDSYANIKRLGVLLASFNVFDYEMCGISPSLQAASCLLFAIRIHEYQSNTRLITYGMMEDLSRVSNHSEDSIKSVADMIESNVRVFREKFPGCNFFYQEHMETFQMITSKETLYI